MGVSQRKETDPTGAMIGKLVANQKLFEKILSKKDVQWIYEKPRDAISIMCKAVRNRNKIAPKQASKEDEIIDTIIRVDRTQSDYHPEYYQKDKDYLFPGLINSGPVEYDINDIEEWCHDDQLQAAIQGAIIIDFIRQMDNPVRYLGLADILSIRKKGPELFRSRFGSKKVIAWRSAFKAESEFTPGEYFSLVPCLSLAKNGEGRTFKLDWRNFDWQLFDVTYVSLRFKNNSLTAQE